MPRKKVRLGRGLGALLGDVKTTTKTDGVESREGVRRIDESARRASAATMTTAEFREVPIEMLERGEYQPRVRMDKTALAELGESIKSQGVLQPLLVRPLSQGRYEIIAGERRWRGAQLAGLATLPVVVREISNQTAMAVGLIENIQRENLNAIEEAQGYHRLIDEFGLTHQEVSEVVGYSRAAVTNLLRLLALHAKVQEMVHQKSLDMGHARALLGLPQNQQPEVAAVVQNKGLSVRQTERLVKSLVNPLAKNKPIQTQSDTADIAHLEEDLARRIGTKVQIQHGAGKGKLVIHYYSLDELDGIIEKIK